MMRRLSDLYQLPEMQGVYPDSICRIMPGLAQKLFILVDWSLNT